MLEPKPDQLDVLEPFRREVFRNPGSAQFESFEHADASVRDIQVRHKHVMRLDDHSIHSWTLQGRSFDPIVGESDFTLSDEFKVSAAYTLYSHLHGISDIDVVSTLTSLDTILHEENGKEDVMPEMPFTFSYEKFYVAAEQLSNATLQYLALLSGTVGHLKKLSQQEHFEKQLESDSELSLMCDASIMCGERLFGSTIITIKDGLSEVFDERQKGIRKSFQSAIESYKTKEISVETLSMLQDMEMEFDFHMMKLETYFTTLYSLCRERREILERIPYFDMVQSKQQEMLYEVSDQLPEKTSETNSKNSGRDSLDPDVGFLVLGSEMRTKIAMTAAQYFLRRPYECQDVLRVPVETLEEVVEYEFAMLKGLEGFEDFDRADLEDPLVASVARVKSYFLEKVHSLNELLSSEGN